MIENADPAKVAADAQRLSYPARIALPATLANTLSQERVLKELDDKSRDSHSAGAPVENVSLIPAGDGFVQFSVQLVIDQVIFCGAQRLTTLYT